MKAIKPIPSAALSRLRAITPRNGQRYWRQTREKFHNRLSAKAKQPAV
jgi:hypothetical protein